MKINKGIKSIRRFKNFTQKQLADKLGVTSVTIQNYENNRRNPSVEMLTSIADVLDVELSIILDGFEQTIYTNSDILYSWKKLNVKLSIPCFLSSNNQPTNLFFIFNEPDTLDGCYLISEKLRLSENELFNWIKSMAIKKYILEDKDLKAFFSDELTKKILKRNILINQSNNSLFYEGLSSENKALVRNFIFKRDFREIQISQQNKHNYISNKFNLLNDLGQKKVISYINDLLEMPKYKKESNITSLPKREKQIWEEEGKEYLMPKASHDKEGDFTEEDYKHDDDLMNDEDLWK